MEAKNASNIQQFSSVVLDLVTKEETFINAYEVTLEAGGRLRLPTKSQAGVMVEATRCHGKSKSQQAGVPGQESCFGELL